MYVFCQIGPTHQKQIKAPIITKGIPIHIDTSKFDCIHIQVPNQIEKATKIANKIIAGYNADNKMNKLDFSFF